MGRARFDDEMVREFPGGLLDRAASIRARPRNRVRRRLRRAWWQTVVPGR
jgi:hypothetical protein